MTDGRVAAIARHPVKGFTPEPLDAVALEAGAAFPCDRLYAVEDGPSGFDPAAPAHVSKMKFTVLAKIPAVAALRTRFNDATHDFALTAPDGGHATFGLATEAGKAGLAAWLTDRLGEHVRGPLRVIEGPGAHRFMDHPQGAVSLINLASLRDLEARTGRVIDPARFRANLAVEGWPAWAEMDMVGGRVRVGGATLSAFKPIVRCAATHVDAQTAVRDVEMTRALFDHYGHMFFGIYLTVEARGMVEFGDVAAPAG